MLLLSQEFIGIIVAVVDVIIMKYLHCNVSVQILMSSYSWTSLFFLNSTALCTGWTLLPTTCVDILTMCEDFCVKFYTTLNNKHILYNQVWLQCIGKWQKYTTSTKTTHISQRSEICLHRCVMVVVKSVVDQLRMQTWRRTDLLQMLGVTTIGSHNHVGSQVLGEVCHRLVDVFLWQLFPGVCTHQSS